MKSAEEAKKSPGSATPCLSHNIWVPEQTTDIGPFAALRAPGQLHNTAKSAVRALDVVELLSEAEGPLRAVEIAKAIGLSPSSADQLLKTMMDSAFLIFDPVSKRYYLSPRLSKLGVSLGRAYFGEGAVDRLMDAVHQELGKPVHLLTSQGSFMQVIQTTGSVQTRTRMSHVALQSGRAGVRVPLFGSCSGAAWLSCQSEETIRAAIALCRRELGREAKSPGRIFELIHRAKEQGYAVGGVTPDNLIGGIAVALPKSGNGIVLVVSVAAPVAELKERQHEIVGVLDRKIVEHLIADAGQGIRRHPGMAPGVRAHSH